LKIVSRADAQPAAVPDDEPGFPSESLARPEVRSSIAAAAHDSHSADVEGGVVDAQLVVKLFEHLRGGRVRRIDTVGVAVSACTDKQTETWSDGIIFHPTK
jgi:hypothetical protein